MNDCPYCQSRNLVEVYGHVQCAKCEINIVSCSEGTADESRGICTTLLDSVRNSNFFENIENRETVAIAGSREGFESSNI